MGGIATASGARVDVGSRFWGGSSGKWAGEQMLRALKEGRGLTPAALRTLDTLRKDEWKAFDEALVQEAAIRLRAVADLYGAGLVKPITNGLAKTVLEYEKVTDMNPATTSLDGMTRTEGDRQEFSLSSLPLPITHKDFWINLRTLMASRERGEALDTTQVRTAGRLCAEAAELMLFAGGKTFGGLPIYGYLTHPNRNLDTFGTNGNWAAAAKTGADCLEDVLSMIALLEADRMYGPYWLYVPSNSSTKLEEDFKANGDQTIRERLLKVDRLEKITVVDQLTANNLVMVQATSDVVQMVEGEALQTIQWDIEGGFQINFKAFQIQVPLIRADAQDRCGIVHMS
jgi:uncharacterized linocin/CFP29 family protein